MAGSSLLALLDDIASILDDVALTYVVDEPERPQGDIETNIVVEAGTRDQSGVFCGHGASSVVRLRGERREEGRQGTLRAEAAEPRWQRGRLPRTSSRGSQGRREGRCASGREFAARRSRREGRRSCP